MQPGTMLKRYYLLRLSSLASLPYRINVGRGLDQARWGCLGQM